MVIVEYFEFQIVSAENKIPFKEHKKGLNTYVEVEPDAEYFLSVRKVGNPSTRYVFKLKVDGKELGCYNRRSIRASSTFVGIYSRANGVRTRKALKFVKASFTSGDTGISTTMAGMGKIEMEVYNAIYTGVKKMRDTLEGTFATSAIAIEDKATVTMKKNLRSGEGHSVNSSTYDITKLRKRYSTGDHLHTITLHYCATPGLIAVGVLAKPQLWDYHRVLNPINITAKKKAKLDKMVTSVKRTRNGSEILTLDDSDSDSDSYENTEID